MVPLKIVSNVSRFKPALNLNRVLADLNHGSNSLNSISGLIKLAENLRRNLDKPETKKETYENSLERNQGNRLIKDF